MSEEFFILSIIIPMYNAANSIERCLKSIVGQLICKDYIEIIVIDDGSKDDCFKLVQKYCDKYDCIRIIRQNNKGVGYARNVGIENAKGKYIWFVDADDMLYSNALNFNFLNELLNSDYDMYIFGIEKIYGNKKTEIVNSNNLEIQSQMELKNSFNSIFLENLLNPLWNKIFLRSFIQNNEIRFSNLKTGEDAEFNYKAIGLADKIKVINKIKYIYYLDSVTSVKKDYYDNHLVDAYSRLLKMSKMLQMKKMDVNSEVKRREVLDVVFGEELNIFNKNRQISYINYRKYIKNNIMMCSLMREIGFSFSNKKYLLKAIIAKNTLLSYFYIKNVGTNS